MQTELLKRWPTTAQFVGGVTSKCTAHATRCDTRTGDLRIAQRQLSSFTDHVIVPVNQPYSPDTDMLAGDYSQLFPSIATNPNVPLSYNLLLLFHTHQTRDVFHCQRTNVGIIGARAEFRWEFPSALEIHKHYTARRHVYNGKWNRGLFAKRTFLMCFKLQK